MTWKWEQMLETGLRNATGILCTSRQNVFTQWPPLERKQMLHCIASCACVRMCVYTNAPASHWEPWIWMTHSTVPGCSRGWSPRIRCRGWGRRGSPKQQEQKCYCRAIVWFCSVRLWVSIVVILKSTSMGCQSFFRVCRERSHRKKKKKVANGRKVRRWSVNFRPSGS